MAKYVAGQALTMVGERIYTLKEVFLILQEFVERQVGRVFLIPNLGNIPEPARNFLAMQAWINGMHHFLNSTMEKVMGEFHEE